MYAIRSYYDFLLQYIGGPAGNIRQFDHSADHFRRHMLGPGRIGSDLQDLPSRLGFALNPEQTRQRGHYSAAVLVSSTQEPAPGATTPPAAAGWETASSPNTIRITSYNVCYTKLLRSTAQIAMIWSPSTSLPNSSTKITSYNFV